MRPCHLKHYLEWKYREREAVLKNLKVDMDLSQTSLDLLERTVIYSEGA